MKKILLSIFSLTLLMCMNLNAQSERLVFVEEFTQASCPPCETTTPELNATLEANADKVIQLRYQTSWPGVDPMNADNPAEVQDRVTYYGVTGVPNVFMDGVEPTGVTFPTLISEANINANYSADGAPVKVEVTHELSAELDSMDITVTITNEGTMPYMVPSNRLRVAIVEEVVEWVYNPGSTSILDYEYVMKSFVTGTPGMEITEIAALGGFWENSWKVAVPANVYNFNEIGVVAFIQDDMTRAVVNAGKSDAVVRADYPELQALDAGSGSAEFCNYDYSPAVEVVNHGGGTCTGYDVVVSINGTAAQTITVTDPLMGGASNTVNFDVLQLDPGANTITYAIENTVERDIGILNDLSAPLNFSKASDGLPELTVGFEDETVGTRPSNGSVFTDFNAINFIVFDSDGIGGSGPVGGFGESDKAMMINFWQWNPANVNPNGSMAVLDRWLVPDNGDSTFVTFDYAYTSWQGSADRLIVEVSSDCGETFTELFNKAGADLRTTPELNLGNAFLIPESGDWVNVELDITDWAGEVVMVRFSVVSAWGDQLWLDNINTETRMVSSNENLVDVQGLEVFPNPAKDFATVAFELAEAKNVRFTLVDNLGRVVSTQNYGTRAGSQNISLDLSDLANGVYMLRGQFGDEISVNKISVSK